MQSRKDGHKGAEERIVGHCLWVCAVRFVSNAEFCPQICFLNEIVFGKAKDAVTKCPDIRLHASGYTIPAFIMRNKSRNAAENADTRPDYYRLHRADQDVNALLIQGNTHHHPSHARVKVSNLSAAFPAGNVTVACEHTQQCPEDTPTRKYSNDLSRPESDGKRKNSKGL
ncbi:hypothetical protein Ddc_09004 [Ditylenchus destructor]|nr:hypothetical protein Ddc_09004 [Ditylenchus destructor]